jgi:hypothetical protein
MDTTTLFLFEKIRRNEAFEYTELFNFLILIPLITYILNNANKYLTDITSICKNKINTITTQVSELVLDATETLDKDGGYYYYYSKPILSLCYLVKCKKIRVKFKHIRCPMGTGKDFVIQSCNNLEIDKDIYLSVEDLQNEESKKNNQNVLRYTLKTHSRDLEEFLDNLIEEYSKKLSEKNVNKLWHFIYKGNGGFSQNLISDIKNNPNLETFDKIFNEHSLQIQNDIDRLKNIDYYCRTGLKRKKGYLFYGEPGCGKTTTVMAMANYDNRHIIEVPLSRVKTNQEIEDILNLSNEWLMEFNKNEVIILFDEIDCNMKKIENRKKFDITTDETKSTEKNNEIKDEKTVINLPNLADLDLGTILSRLDGIGNYNGLIIVATTNHKDKLDPALYRELRLTPIEFSYSRKEDMIKMIEQFYDIKLKDCEKIKIPDRNAKISPAKFRCLLEKYEEDYRKLLNIFK